jgi:hypothetical protein
MPIKMPPRSDSWRLFYWHMVVGCYQRANELGIAISGPD